MKRSNTTAMISLAGIGLFFSAVATANSWLPELVPQSSVDMCVAQIADHADYTAATRVRHEVKSEQRRTVGHTLRIDTLVYGNSDGKLIREYATKCVVGNGLEPVVFVIEETVDGA
ncbi:MAG: hypothetical protein ACR2RD_08035 [Woeseiaceae bacterium]